MSVGLAHHLFEMGYGLNLRGDFPYALTLRKTNKLLSRSFSFFNKRHLHLPAQAVTGKDFCRRYYQWQGSNYKHIAVGEYCFITQLSFCFDTVFYAFYRSICTVSYDKTSFCAFKIFKAFTCGLLCYLKLAAC